MLQCLLAAAIGATARKPHAATANKLSMFGMFLWELLLFLYICTATQRDWSNFISKVGTAKYLDPGVAGKLKAEAEGIILSASFLPEQFFIRLRTCFFVTGTVIF